MTTITKEKMFYYFAPNFNFELDADQIVAEGLRVGFITPSAEADVYIVNEEYVNEDNY